ncbi:MOSC domain-containing protein [Actinomadura rudentiformis]|uniref:MOSC domain-containing protein n=1 Tax=Actinomadura rudentiformis TaxID=359158 RepID=A0A6H9YNF3_9ACTN|nr:MOSC N-terminal beta barrel domain-containing protein [Actinomadura rudentiformis]KAB2344052.1 MOSC domain-containing protein [Actinomadura rudentiformis]
MPTHLGTVAAIRRHPVKSMLGEEITAADVSPGGVTGDRAWALIDRETGKVASAKNPRLWRSLLTLSATLHDGAVRIVLPGGKTVHSTDADIDDVLSAFLGRPVTLTSTPPAAATLDRAVPEEVLAAGVTAEVEAEEITLGLGAPPGGFVDFAPVHLIGTATLAAIAAASPRGTVEPVRYRPNLIIETTGAAYGENGWTGRELAIGDEVILRVLAPTPRCAIPTLEHGELPRDPAALRVPAAHNRVEPVEGLGLRACAGVYADVVRSGRVRQDDGVTLL